VAIIDKNNLAKFGYILDMKVEKKILSVFLATFLNKTSKSGDLEFFSLKSGKFVPFFP
jgi:hypothetical protein